MDAGGAGGAEAGWSEADVAAALVAEEEDGEPVTSAECPITGAPMCEPVVAADGHTYERSAMERWLRDHDTSPLTGEVLPTKALFPNRTLAATNPPLAAAKAGYDADADEVKGMEAGAGKPKAATAAAWDDGDVEPAPGPQSLGDAKPAEMEPENVAATRAEENAGA
uniref:U-box domain-containing protein n=1 Tax=Phaeomonas parva TaxID=124430 RepID=A0A7S1UFM5_9STRA